MAKPLSQRFLPCNDAILVRKPEAATATASGKEKKLVLVEKDEDSGKLVQTTASPRKRCLGIVVAIGRGTESENGVIVPPDPNIVVGGEVCFNPAASFQFEDMPEMKEEGLYIVPMTAVLGRILPA